MAPRYFRQRIGHPLLTIRDRLSAHRANAVSAFLATHPDDYAVEWLPADAADLNPAALGNGAAKQAMLNAVPDPVEALLHQARHSFNRLGRRSEVLGHFFHHAGLDVT